MVGVAEGAVEPEEGAAVLEPVVATVAATVLATAMVMLVVMLVVTVLAMVLVMVAVTAVAMVTVLLPARATATAGGATWSAPVAGQRSRHPAVSIARVRQPDDCPPRHLDGRIHQVG